MCSTGSDETWAYRRFGYPGAHPVHEQQELNNGPILAVAPNDGEPWIAVFGGSNYKSRVLSWPGGRSLCVLHGFDAVVVRTDAPDDWFAIDSWPLIQDVRPVPALGLVVFTTYAGVAAYGENGQVWKTRFGWDDIDIVGIERDRLLLRGTERPDGGSADFSVDLRTGVSTDDPYEPQAFAARVENATRHSSSSLPSIVSRHS